MPAEVYSLCTNKIKSTSILRFSTDTHLKQKKKKLIYILKKNQSNYSSGRVKRGLKNNNYIFDTNSNFVHLIFKEWRLGEFSIFIYSRCQYGSLTANIDKSQWTLRGKGSHTAVLTDCHTFKHTHTQKYRHTQTWVYTHTHTHLKCQPE